MSAESNKKKFNKIFLAIPVAITMIIVLFVVFSINMDIAEHRAFEEVEVDPCGFYLDGFDVRLDLCMYNPSSTDARLDRIDVFIFAGKNNIAEVTIPKYITIPKNTEIIVPADITIRKTGLLTAGLDYLFDKDTNLRADGTVYYDSPFGTHEITFSRDYSDSWQNNQELSRQQQCNNVVNDFLDVFEFALQTGSSEAEMDQIMLSYGYDLQYGVPEIDRLCDVDPRQGLISSPYLDTQTKQRAIDLFSYLMPINP